MLGGLHVTSLPGEAAILLERAVACGLRSLFVGFETLNPANLAEQRKYQNMRRDYTAAIRRLHDGDISYLDAVSGHGASAHGDLLAGLRHLGNAAGWKKFEPLWDFIIRAKRAGAMLPVLEMILSEFGRRRAGNAVSASALADCKIGRVVDS